MFNLLFKRFCDIISVNHDIGNMSCFFMLLRCGGIFVITKGEKMQKVSYMGNGSTTEFSFNFPYFESSNIVVTKNNTAATGYSVIGTSAGQNADIPYTGGKVVFETAPTALDSITIARSLPLARIVDYQPTAKIEPTTLNQDLNYTMEVIKDLQDEIDSLYSEYADIADKESTTTLLARISAIHDEIVTVSAQITALGDVTQIAKKSEIPTNATMSSMSMPATNTNVTQMFPTTLEVGTTYEFTAPSDGYAFFGSSGLSNVFIYVSSVTHGYTIGGLVVGASTGGVIRGQLVIPKGAKVAAAVYNNNNTNFTASFIPSNGSI